VPRNFNPTDRLRGDATGNPSSVRFSSARKFEIVFQFIEVSSRYGITVWEDLLRLAVPGAPVSRATLRRWIARFLKFGMAGLADKARNDLAFRALSATVFSPRF
jgi:hypothetical protein